MEESVWLYFGVIVILITVAIITSIFIKYQHDSSEQFLFDGLQQLRTQVNVVCDAPKDTMLSVPVSAPADAQLRAYADRICVEYRRKTRCEPVACDLQPAMLLNLSNVTLFTSRTYTCSALRGTLVTVNCQG
jgi:hypothetical protein